MKTQIKKTVSNTIAAATGASNNGITWNRSHYYSVNVPDCYIEQTEEVKDAGHSCEHMCCFEDEDGDEHLFVPANIELKIIGNDRTITLGAWVGLSPLDFEHFQATNDLPDGYGSYMGILGNDLPGYPSTYGEPVMVDIFNLLHPPTVVFHADHPLSKDMNEGISAEQAAKYIALMDSITQ